MKPKIICHIMSSVDGRVINSRWSEPFDGRPQSDLTKVYAQLGSTLDTDAWMFGLNTAKAFLPLKFVGKKHYREMPREPYIAPRTSRRLFVFADPDAGIYYNTSKVRGDDIAVILSENVADEYLIHLQKAGVSYLFGGADGTDLRQAMETLGEIFCVKSISLQGGGIIDGAMLAAGLLDELSIVMYPGIDGLAGVPSIFQYVGGATEHPAEGQSLELLDAEKCDYGIVWLRYKFHHKNNKK